MALPALTGPARVRLVRPCRDGPRQACLEAYDGSAETGVGLVRRPGYMANRLGPRQRGYDQDWERLRRKMLAGRPICATYGCGARATMVDHIEPVRLAPHRRLDPSNLQPLCLPCHNRLTVAFERSNPAIGLCREDGSPDDSRHPWAQADNAGALRAVRDAETGVGGTETGKGPSPAVAALVGRLKRRAVRRR
jgi:hypothetical protein